MLSRTWRIVFLVIALVTIIWPDLLGNSTWWVALVAITVLLIAEISCDNKCEIPKTNNKPVKRKLKRKRR